MRKDPFPDPSAVKQQETNSVPLSLIQIVDSAHASSVERSGLHLVCRPGCAQCCHGVFPISHQDAARLREGFDALERLDPQRAQHIRSRTADSLTRISPIFPGDPATGILDEDYEESMLFGDESEDGIGNTESCPVLDPATGTCDLYESRPIVCRTFGPPMRTPDGNLATCELCFLHASTEEIAAAELDPSIPSLEVEDNAAYNAAHHLRGETIVAYALVPHKR